MSTRPQTKRKQPRPKPKANGKAKKNGNGNGQTRNSQPVTVSTMQRAIANSTQNARPAMTMPCTVSGTDFLAKLVVTTAPITTAARIIYSASISPSFFQGTRLTTFSNLYERYLFNKFQVRYVPAVPTTLACQLLAYIDTDPTDDPTSIADADALFRQAVAQSGSRQWNFISGQSIPLVIKRDKTLYYTGATRVAERLNLQGKVYILQITNPIAFDGAPIDSPTLEAGSLFMDWNVTFSTPQINPEAAQYVSLGDVYSLPAPALTKATGLMAFDGYLSFVDLEPNSTYIISPRIRVDPTGFPTVNSILAFTAAPPRFRLGDNLDTSIQTRINLGIAGCSVSQGGTMFVRTSEEGVANIAFDNNVTYVAVYNWSVVGNNYVDFDVSRLYV